MDLSVLISMLRRRWYVAALVVLLALPLGSTVIAGLGGDQVATARVLLLPPGKADPATGQRLPHNAYLSDTGALDAAATAIAEAVDDDTVRDEVGEAGFRTDYAVSAPGDAPVIEVVSEAPSGAAAAATASHVADIVVEMVASSTRGGEAAVDDQVRAVPVHRPEMAEPVSTQRARIVTALTLLVLVGILGVTLLVETTQAGLAMLRGDRPEVWGEHGTGGDGARQLLVIYVVSLVLLPQRYALGGFQITGPMMVAFLGAWIWVYGKALPLPTFARGVRSVQRALLVLGLVLMTSYASSQLRPLEGFEVSGANRKTTVLLALFAVSVLAADGLRRVESIRRVLGALVAVLAFAGAIGVMQFVFRYDFEGLTRLPFRNGLPRATGTAHHPIDFGVACSSGFALALHFLATARTGGQRALALVATGLIGAGAAVSMSRSSILGLMVVMAVLLVWRRGALRWRTLAMAAAGGLLVLVMVPGVLDAYGGLFSDTGDDNSIRGRTSDYGPVFELWEEFPLLGRGFGTFDPTGYFVLDNSFLKVLLELGAVGLVAWVWLLVAGVGTAARARRLTDDDVHHDLAVCLAAMMASLAVSGFFYDVLFFQMGAGMLFLGLGCAGALHRVLSEARDAAPDPVTAPDGSERVAVEV